MSKIYSILQNFQGGSPEFNYIFVGKYVEASRGQKENWSHHA